MVDLKDLKIGFVAGTLGRGGAEQQLYYMLKALSEGGARARVLSLGSDECWEEPIRSLGVQVTHVGRQRSRVGRVRAISAALREDRPDILQSQHFYTNLYVVAAARTLGIPEIGAIRSSASWEVRDLGRVFGRLSLRGPRVVAANSQAAICNAIALGIPASRLRLLPNVVDTDVFTPGQRQADGYIRVLAVGRRTPQKRFDRFLSVLAAVRQRTSKAVRGVLVTPGDAGSDGLERYASDLGLSADALEIRTAVTDMPAIYREADIFLLTSDFEGTPNVVLEAMASGLPVVATQVGGVPEIIRHNDTGCLADPHDEAALTRLVLDLIEDGEARVAMGRRARTDVVDQRSVRRLPAILHDFYARVTA